MRKFVNVRDLDIDLIDRINPFDAAYAVLAKAMDEKSLRQVQAAIAAKKVNIPEDEAIQSNLVSRAIEAAQAKIEGYHFDMRKHVLEYDEVMNKHRDVVYKMRRQFISPESAGKIKETILDMLRGEVKSLVLSHASATDDVFDIEGIVMGLARIVPINESAGSDLKNAAENVKSDQEKLNNLALSFVETAYRARQAELGEEAMAQIGKLVLLRTIDELWMDHLEEMEHLRDSVNLRAYGQRDPLVEYKTEGHRLFQDFLAAFESQAAGLIFRVGMVQRQATSYVSERIFHVSCP